MWKELKGKKQKTTKEDNLYMGQNIRKMFVYISDFWLLRKLSQGQSLFTYRFVLVF